MASHLVPRHVEIVPELPKTAIGGIRKHELRKYPVREEWTGGPSSGGNSSKLPL